METFVPEICFRLLFTSNSPNGNKELNMQTKQAKRITYSSGVYRETGVCSAKQASGCHSEIVQCLPNELKLLVSVTSLATVAIVAVAGVWSATQVAGTVLGIRWVVT